MQFSLLQPAITCLRGSRSTKHHFDFSEAIDLICRESCLDNREFDVVDNLIWTRHGNHYNNVGYQRGAYLLNCIILVSIKT